MSDLDADIAACWERIARLDGWQEAHDADDDVIVVFHEAKSHHYTGPDAWKLAALHEDCPHCGKVTS